MHEPTGHSGGPLPTDDAAARLESSGQAEPRGTDAAEPAGPAEPPAAPASPIAPPAASPTLTPPAEPSGHRSSAKSPAQPSGDSPATRHRAADAPAWLRDLSGAWIFYSVLPAWPAIEPRFERIARFAPWIGAVLGGLQGLLWWSLEGQVPLLAQVCLVLAAGLWLSGGLHMDGAMDTADGLAAGQERLLEAMADSRVGASGVQALVVVLLLRAGALASLGPLAPLALVWAAAWGRLAPLIAMARFPYLRERGSAAFHRLHWGGLARELKPALLLVASLVLLSWRLQGAAVMPLPLATLGLLPALLVPLWLGRRLGGHSGDSYGACVEWSESLALLIMALAGLLAGHQP